MSMGLLFWILMLIWLVFGLLQYWGPPGWPANYGLWAYNLFLFILLLLLGWQVFGAPIR